MRKHLVITIFLSAFFTLTGHAEGLSNIIIDDSTYLFSIQNGETLTYHFHIDTTSLNCSKSDPVSAQEKKQHDSKSTLIVILSFLIVIEGLLGLWLLWKLCRKDKVLSNRTRKMKQERTKQYLTLLRKLQSDSKVKSCERLGKAIDRVDTLITDSETLTKVIQDPTQFQNDRRFDKLNQIITTQKKFQQEIKQKDEKLLMIQQSFDNLTNSPDIVLQNSQLRQTQLYQIMNDLKLLKSSKKIDLKSLQTDAIKDSLELYVSDTKKFRQLKSYESYFKNINQAIHHSFHQLQNQNNKDNIRTLLLYLAQFYSVSVTLWNIYDPDGASNKFEEDQIESHQANVQPFCNKVASMDDITSLRNKGRDFKNVGAIGQEDLIKYLQQFKPLDFNLLGTYYQKYL